MRVGIGLPSAVPGVNREGIVEWARRAEAAGFSTLAVLDRINYSNLEPLVCLAAAAAVTERIELMTDVLLAPLRSNTALLAKQVSGIDAIAGGGRLTLGVGVGGREDDYEASGVDFRTRGKIMDAMLKTWDEAWSGDAIGPAGRPGLLIGGTADAAYRRAAEHADGWILGGGTPDQFAEGKAKLEAAWRRAGRDGTPRTASLCYFALGDDAQAHADGYLKDYYAFLGEYADMVAGSAATDADTIRGYVQGFTAVGCDELICFPCNPDPGQVDLLADAVG